MKTISFFTALFLSLTSLGQNPEYDPELAGELGADDYGMKTYIFVILKSGSVVIDDADSSAALMRGHLDNIRRLADEGKLALAGPFGKNDSDFRGLFILDVSTEEEAEKLLSTDPAISAGVFETEVMPWYGSAALPAYLETHRKIAKTNP
jgi:uncharacterized protein YciI